MGRYNKIFYLKNLNRLFFSYISYTHLYIVVTGATDGLGKSFAKKVNRITIYLINLLFLFNSITHIKLAEVGLNVVLISRSPSKLETVADEISIIIK